MSGSQKKRSRRPIGLIKHESCTEIGDDDGEREGATKTVAVSEKIKS